MSILNSKSKMVVNIALHALVWGFWFAAPILFSFNDPQRNEPPKDFFFYFMTWTPMLFSLFLFYLNYFVLVDKFLFNKKILLFFVINFALIIALSYCTEGIREAFRVNFPIKEGGPRPPKGFILGIHNFSFLFVVSISVAIRTTGRWYVTENQRKNLENENLKSELSNLKMQLNPHFFFNTLNNIYSLIRTSPDKAQESIHGLAKLMRYHLYETNEEKVPLSGEVEFLKSYISLMQLRLSSNVRVENEFTIENPTVQIAPLLFISLVENSFKHGISPVEESYIKIKMVEQNKILSFEIQNTDYPQKSESLGDIGIGLENLKKRLTLIYPEKHSFTHDCKNNIYHVKVIIGL